VDQQGNVMTRRAAIVLAGGKGERFQKEQIWQDKAFAELFGKPLLVHAVGNVFSLVDEIVVCVNTEERKTLYTEVLTKQGFANIRLLVDKKNDCVGGPLVAILTGLESAKTDFCLTLPVDMPLVEPKVVDYMFTIDQKARVVVPMWPNGRLETLFMVLERSSSLEIAVALCMLGRPRSDDIIRGTSRVEFVSIIGALRKIDPELKTFVNINAQEDLIKLQPRRIEGVVNENLHVDRGALPTGELLRMREASAMCQEGKFAESEAIFAACAEALENKKSFFWAAVSREKQGKSLKGLSKQESNLELAANTKTAFLKASTNYELEAKEHEKSRCAFLAERARNDKIWCESRANEH
jgi:molybdopterin-guanine dinucleotide biosynthesis protein A